MVPRQCVVAVAALPLLLSAHEVIAGPMAEGDAAHTAGLEPFLTPAERMQRAAGIRDAACQVGMTNAALLAGIAQAETGLAHCWSEATWACEGPASSSCGGGPVIAGAADGPCYLQQGGLGMFQFDAGTFTDTINTYGADVVTVEGNTQQVIPFLQTRAIQSVEGVDSDAEALDWFNAIPIADGDADFEDWIYFVAWRYNGCQGCYSVQKKYRDATHQMISELGADFWECSESQEEPEQSDCEPVPNMGRIVEENEPCFRRDGPAEYWGAAEAGHGGSLSWTTTTDADVVDNIGTWELAFRKAGDYRVSVYTDGGTFGQSTMATYEIAHGTELAEVVLDQSAMDGFQSLGVFRFEADGEQWIRLADNTGEPWAADGTRLMFDAVRVLPAKPGETGEDEDGDGEPDGKDDMGESGGCSTSSGGSSAALGLLLGALLMRRRFSVRFGSGRQERWQ